MNCPEAWAYILLILYILIKNASGYINLIVVILNIDKVWTWTISTPKVSDSLKKLHKKAKKDTIPSCFKQKRSS
jgi:hypothetical protein